MFDRIAPVYDVMNRVMTAGLDQRWRRATVERGRRSRATASSTPPAAPATWRSSPRRPARTVTGLDFSEKMLERARRKAPELEWVQRRPARASVRRRHLRRGDSRLRHPQRRRPRAGSIAELRRVLRPGGRLGDPRDHATARAAARLLLAVVRPHRAAARQGAARRRGVHVPAGERPPLSRAGRPRRADGTASATSTTGCSPAASSRCTPG